MNEIIAERPRADIGDAWPQGSLAPRWWQPWLIARRYRGRAPTICSSADHTSAGGQILDLLGGDGPGADAQIHAACKGCRISAIGTVNAYVVCGGTLAMLAGQNISLLITLPFLSRNAGPVASSQSFAISPTMRPKSLS